MTTVEKFTSYYLRRLWREGDQELTDDLPMLVKEAEARMSRDIREHSLAQTVNLAADPITKAFTIPADYLELLSASFDGYSPARLVSMDELSRIRRVTQEGRSNVFAMQGGFIHIAHGNLAGIPKVKFSYFIKVPPAPMEQPDENMGFYDLHPDFFLSALDVQVYAYLREYELSQEKNGIYAGLLETMIRNSNYARWPSGQLDPWASEPRGDGRTFITT